MTKDLIAFLAMNKDLQFFMAIGASFMNVHVDFWETPSSINLPLVMLSATFCIFLSFICTFGDHFFGVIISGTST